jgi:hypothetical protein
MKEFVLPSRWYVVVTPENVKDTFKWRMKKAWRMADPRTKRWLEDVDNLIVGICAEGRRGHNPLTVDNTDFGMEITNEEFQEHVLGKKVKKQKSAKEDTKYLIKFLKQHNIL